MSELETLERLVNGNPTPDDLFAAAALVEDMAVIATIISDAQASEAELKSALHGIGAVLVPLGRLMAQGVEGGGAEPAEATKSAA